MRCPFLREAQVRTCQASAYKKMILRMPGASTEEKCSTPEYVHCSAMKQSHEDSPSGDRCPFLQESLARYCSAASVVKYIPYNESAFSRCGSDNHKYCEVYAALAGPSRVVQAPAADAPAGSKPEPVNVTFNVDDIRMPGWLGYSANHLWYDQSDDGNCHVGIDGFLARTLGSVEHIHFVTTKGVQRPAVVLTVRGIDVQLIFPHRINITSVNSYLRTAPHRLAADPYQLGWLFEGTLPSAANGDAERADNGLFRGPEARAWMGGEIRRMTGFAHEAAQAEGVADAVVMMDGGLFAEGLVHHLSRETVLRLVNEFFSPAANWR